MSLNVLTAVVLGGEYTLRLTSKALLQFNLKHGIEGNTPTIAVLGAVSDMAARIDLLSNALQHPDNRNQVRDGGLLLDMMADDPNWDRDRVNKLILDLAVAAGLIDSGESAQLEESVLTNNRKTIKTLGALLSGEALEQAPVSGEPEPERNPT